ncbi:zinc-binding alcohol dehydrogenase family protein [Sphingomonas sp. NFR15]|uniref:zinc-binding alcohol dehydrogenase family protein n=1 Tax=Sphingomonas sp. NFR15 TaxID=1566282 RepID=UPI0008822E4B|nr:zinc-binding alcohol dehydrogenase family protein [Sphingomonas sp. NFR15]SDA35904.1 zinc-binding alcohol dehydrogenase family protein [Sphingomonas sp. NFR15]
MKAVGFKKDGAVAGGGTLVDMDVPEPVAGPRDLIVRIKAVSVNPVDVKARVFPSAADAGPKILGFDAAGLVEAVGSEVSLFKVGDEVFYAGDITRPGTNSELHAVDERIVGRKPASLDWAEAAAMPLTAITAWELLFDRLRLPRGGENGGGSLLIINGAGGVGSILIQMARRLTGLTVIATASREETIDWAAKMGAHHVIDHHKPIDEELVRIGHPTVDYVAGLSASDRYLPIFPKIVAPQGHVVFIDDPAQFDIMPLKRKSISVSLEFMFTRPMFRTSDMIAQHDMLEEISDMLDAGELKSTLVQRLSPINAEAIAEAHRVAESGKAIGKTVIEGF